jgi:uncharacterized protein (DUF2237 family)
MDYQKQLFGKTFQGGGRQPMTIFYKPGLITAGGSSRGALRQAAASLKTRVLKTAFNLPLGIC